MNMWHFKRSSLLILCICFLSNTYTSQEIDYRNKALVKTLEKSGIENFNKIEEINIADTILKTQKLNGKYFFISSHNINNYKYIYIGRVNSCRASGCSLTNANSATTQSEYFDYFILFDEARTVQFVKVFNYQASHGQEITAKSWLKQFIGYDNSTPLVVDKNIDAISGATVSVNAITSDIEAKTFLLKIIIL